MSRQTSLAISPRYIPEIIFSNLKKESKRHTPDKKAQLIFKYFLDFQQVQRLLQSETTHY